MSTLRIASHLNQKILTPSHSRNNTHVAHLIDAIRHEDQVIAVMPFLRHQDFRYYYRTATLPMIRSYMYSLFEALRATHKELIIHRDVKPANFLYDTTTGVGVLCDYGLAQAVGGDEYYEWRSTCCHSLPGPQWAWEDGRAKAKHFMQTSKVGESPGLLSGLHGIRLDKPISLYTQWQALEQDWRTRRKALKDAKGKNTALDDRMAYYQMRPAMMPPEWEADLKARHKEKRSFFANWKPAQQGQSALGQGKAGYLKEDKRSVHLSPADLSVADHTFLAVPLFERIEQEQEVSVHQKFY